MKKTHVCIAFVIFVAAASCAFAIDLTKWKYRSDITIENKTGKYAKLDLTPEVYDKAKLDLSDIRIIDSNLRQVPYLLVKPQDIINQHKYSPNIINRSTNNQNGSMVTLDFGQQTVKNSIEVETSGNNFRRAVKVEGSNDNIAFFTLVNQAFVFAVDNAALSRFNNINLPANDYRYLRITVEPMPTEQQNPLIEDVRTFESEKKLAARTPVEMLLVNQMEDQKTNASIYQYDLKFRNLPVSEIQLQIADDSFYRHVTIEGRNAATRKIQIDSEDNRQRFREVEQSWENITSGTVYRYASDAAAESEKTTLSIPSYIQTYRYIKITIRNYDDRPLNLQSASAEMITHQLIFGAADTSNAALYFGAESVAQPVYDIAHQLNKPSEIKAASAKLGAVTENSSFGQTPQKSLPWTEQHKALLLIIMSAVILVLGVFILKSFKSIKD